jgi:hypothetical protein
MKTISIVGVGLCLLLIALTFVPAVGAGQALCAIGALLCGAVGLVSMIVAWRDAPVLVPASKKQPEVAAVAKSVVVAEPPPARTISGEIELVRLLAILQEKGRFVDFLSDEITTYSDAQVGAAARIVHQGCKGVLDEYFGIAPIRVEAEGSKITIAAGYDADDYRLVGTISGAPPFSGTLMHRGWKAEAVRLPRALRIRDDRLPIIAPAEVELR